MIQLPGYQILEKIYDAEEHVVFKALAKSNVVIIKTSSFSSNTNKENNQLKYEFEILKIFKNPNIIKPISLEVFENKVFLILEDINAKSLDTFFREDNIDYSVFLDIALKILSGLSEIHHKNIIHHDIRPENILYNFQSGELRIIDFGSASTLKKQESIVYRKTLNSKNIPYLSPEKSGRMNRTVDYRTDFYSLGVTLYKLITSKLPFTNGSPIEMIHSHLAKIPTPPSEVSNVPRILSKIIMKLLEKNPEERYQSCFGITQDLLYCKNILETKGETFLRAKSFKLGKEDSTSIFQIPEKLYGREKEISELFSQFKTVESTGKSKISLISGYSGVGKSSLIKEIYKPITTSHGYFMSGKFEQFNNIPFSAIIQIFTRIIQSLLGESNESIEIWKSKILAALDTNAKIITDIIPELEYIIGKQPDYQELTGQENTNRFLIVFKKFVNVFTAKEHPVAIFIDDMQWADSASLNLLSNLLKDSNANYLYIMLAYRVNEVNSSHPFSQMLLNLEENGIKVENIQLQPLKIESVIMLLSDTLHLTSRNVSSLAMILYQKTYGNPFFLIELLKLLHANKIIRYDENKKTWQWKIEDIRKLQISDNVIELLIKKVETLPIDTQYLLKLASCVGNIFDLGTLSIISKQKKINILAALKIAVDEELIKIIENHYQILFNSNEESNSSSPGISFQFQHDKVQQTCFEKIEVQERNRIRYTIGNLLFNSELISKNDEKLFEITGYFNSGYKLITDESEKNILLELNLRASRKAKSSTAYNASLEFLNIAISLFSEKYWTEKYSFSYTLYFEYSEAIYLTGNLDLSIQTILNTIPKCRDDIDKGNFFNLLLVIYSVQGNFKASYEIMIKSLSMFGIEIEGKDSNQLFLEEVDKIKQKLGNRSYSDLIHLPLNENPTQELINTTLISSAATTYQYVPSLFPYINAKLVNIYLEYGNMKDSYGYAAFGIMIGVMFGDHHAAYQCILLAYDISIKYNNLSSKTKAANILANYGNPFVNSLKLSEKINQTGIKAALDSGEFEHGGYCLANDPVILFLRGESLLKLRDLLPEKFILAKTFNHSIALDILKAVEFITQFLVQGGDNSVEQRALENIFVESFSQKNANWPFAIYKVIKQFSNFCLGLYELCFQETEEVEKLLPYISGTPYVAEHKFIQSLIFTKNYNFLSGTEKENILKALNANLAQLKNWAKYCPENYLHKVYLVEAEKFRINGDLWNALIYYDLSLGNAKDNGFIQYAAIANELAGIMLLDANHFKLASPYFIEAFNFYEAWGAKKKNSLLKEKYFLMLKRQEFLSPGSAFFKQPGLLLNNSTDITDQIDLQTIISATQAISSEIDFDNLLKIVIKILIENSGADRGVILSIDNERNANKFILELECSIINNEYKFSKSESIELPNFVVNSAYRMKQLVLLENANAEGHFLSDPYIQKNKSKSILCYPIFNQNRIRGLVYLENTLATNVFTKDRINILNLLSTQIAISIENTKFIKQLDESKKKAEEANTVKSNFIANISHEIRTPMNGIMGMKSLLEGTNLTEEQKEYLHNIGVSSESLLVILNDILDISKIESGKIDIENISFELKQLVEDSINIIKNRIIEKKINFIFNFDPAISKYIITDMARLRQILINLLNNAVKFTFLGSIEFSVILIEKINQHLIIDFSIKDTGIGIEESKLTKIFQPFIQADNSITRKYGGTGLGLAISKNLANLLGGDISVKSELGVGSIFTLRLKVLSHDNFESVSNLQQTSDLKLNGPGEKLSILLVEDNIMNQKVIIRLLQKMGFNINDTANNGVEAINFFKVNPYDIILMDIQMPELDGIEATKLIRSKFQDRKQPIIIALTANAMVGDREKYLEVGMDDYISKPVNPFDLKSKLITWGNKVK